MAITVALVPAAQRKRKRFAMLPAAQRKNQKAEELPLLIDIDNNNIIEFEKKKAAEVLPPPIDIDNNNNIDIDNNNIKEFEKKPSKALEEPPPIDTDNNNIIEFEILSRLPAKSVCRFKSVSKHWKSFLSTHMFGKMHHQMHQNIKKTYKFLLLDEPPVDLCCKPLNHGSVIVGFNRLEKADPRFDLLLASLDGLVCVASTETITGLALWNPLTGAYYKLPSNPNFTRPFDSHKDVIGFYSDSSNDDYKLLYLVSGDGGAYIYSQRLNSWRKIEFLIIGNYDPYHYLPQNWKWSRAIFCDQSLYFLVYRECNDLSIICFDVNSEDFRVIQFPPLPIGARCYNQANIVVIDGCIHLCVGYLIGSSIEPLTQGSIWKLNGDDGTWMEVAFFPQRVFTSPGHSVQVCMTRNAQDSWLAISGGRNNFAPFQVMNMEEFTLIKHVSPRFTYRRIIYDETLVSPNPPSVYG